MVVEDRHLYIVDTPPFPSGPRADLRNDRNVGDRDENPAAAAGGSDADHSGTYDRSENSSSASHTLGSFIGVI